MKKTECRTEHIPRILLRTYDGVTPDMSLKYRLHSELLRQTQFHEETLARVGLTRPSVEETLEYLSMIRSGSDVLGTYSDYD